ncbi:hypothetical protein ACF1AB_22425 [Streptomyces sp. NPDC014846]|uniref:hypothetical protein n=1 Tax=unclassified Streptomyces TaxID=2593676 RepID=UPI0036FA2332
MPGAPPRQWLLRRHRLEQGYSCDEVRGWHPDDRGTHSIRHDCDGLVYRGGHFYRWEGEGRGRSGR